MYLLLCVCKLKGKRSSSSSSKDLLFYSFNLRCIYCVQDTVGTTELRFGDNDTLSAQVGQSAIFN